MTLEEIEETKRFWSFLYDESGVLMEAEVLKELYDFGKCMDA